VPDLSFCLTLDQLSFVADTAKRARDEALHSCKTAEKVFRLAQERLRIATLELRKAKARLRVAKQKMTTRQSEYSS
jgi:hypothetical protein